MNKRFMSAETRHFLYEYIADYAHLCYNYLNGKINPMMKSKSLEIYPETFIEPMPNFKEFRTMAQGYMVVNTVTYNPNTVVAIQETAMSLEGNYKFSIEELRGFVIEGIAHELSHVDQDIDFDSYNRDPEYVIKVETANTINTRRFIEVNKKDICEQLFDFAILDLMCPNIKSDKYSIKDYKKIDFMYQRFISVMNAITLLDMENLIVSSVKKYKTKALIMRASSINSIGSKIDGFDIDLRGFKSIYDLGSDKFIGKLLKFLRSLYTFRGYVVLIYYSDDKKYLNIECQEVRKLPPGNGLIRTVNKIPSDEDQSNIRKHILDRYKNDSRAFDIIRFFN